MLSLSIFDSVTARVGRMNIATILAVVPGLLGIFGMGHIYLGAVRRGITILPIGIGFALICYSGYASLPYVAWSDITIVSTAMITVLALVLVGFIGAIGCLVWQIFDARKIAKQQTTEV